MRVLKWFGGGLVLLVVLVAAIIAIWSRDTAPTHPALASADLAPIIPVRDFWADRAGEWAYKPSHNGQWIAWTAVEGTQDVVRIAPASDMSAVTSIRDVTFYYWDDVRATLLAIIENRLWRIDPDAPDREDWQDVTPRGFQGWLISNRPRIADAPWLIASRDRNPAFADLYTVSQNGGDKELVLENEGQTMGWVLNSTLDPIIRIDSVAGGDVSYLVHEDDAWRELLRLSINTTFRIEEVADDGSYALVVSGRDRDKAALVRVDLATGAEDVLVEDPDEDIFDVFNLDPHDGVIDAVFTHVGHSEIRALTPRGETFARLVHSKADRVEVDGTFWAGDGRYVTATLSPDALNYSYHLFDLDTGNETQLGTFSFRQKHGSSLVRTDEVTIPARDGTQLHGLLVQPQGVTDPAPLMIEVHGGPALHLSWEYHHFRQFLANRGYAVLAVNFRGSTGFGQEFQSKGFGQYGRAMQDDLVDAASWAVAEGIADPDAIGITGGSYGGYASAMAMVRDGDVFKAGVVEHAVLDVAYQMRNNPFAWGLSSEYTTRYFGDTDNAEDLAVMEDLSPMNRVEDLMGPVLVVAGKRDAIVGFEQSEEFLRRAEEAGKTVDQLIFEDEGHGIGRWQNRIRHARAVEDFLAEHLGGRSGGWDWIELAVEYLD